MFDNVVIARFLACSYTADRLEICTKKNTLMKLKGSILVFATKLRKGTKI